MNRQQRRKLERRKLERKQINDKLYNGDYRVISFEKLHQLSTENKDKFNQNVWTEKILESHPNMKGRNLIVQKIMEHNHHRGVEVKPHLRTIVMSDVYKGTLIQDMSYEQFENLEFPPELN